MGYTLIVSRLREEIASSNGRRQRESVTLEPSGGMCPAKKTAQAKLHLLVMVRLESRFGSEAAALLRDWMMVYPIIDKVCCQFGAE